MDDDQSAWVATQEVRLETVRFIRDTVFVREDGSTYIVKAGTVMPWPTPGPIQLKAKRG